MARRAEPLPPSKPLPRPERVAAFQRGLSAESRAALLLIAKAYRILARRWKTPFGEIDIVARRRGVVVFVEVKARTSIDEAAEAVTERNAAPHRQRFHLLRSHERTGERRNLSLSRMAFDAINSIHKDIEPTLVKPDQHRCP
jgi:Holliday junction resolvase-like predicted endonuclease